MDTFSLIPISLFFDTCQSLSNISCHCVPVQDPPKTIAAKYAGCLLSYSVPLPSLSFMGNSSMIFPLLCSLSSFKIQAVSGCQLSCFWIPLSLLLSSKSFLSLLIFRIVRSSLRHSFPHPSFVLICGFSLLFKSLYLGWSQQFVTLPPHCFRYACWLSFPRGRTGLWLLVFTAQAVPWISASLLYNQFCSCMKFTKHLFTAFRSWVLLTILNKFPFKQGWSEIWIWIPLTFQLPHPHFRLGLWMHCQTFPRGLGGNHVAVLASAQAAFPAK